MATVSAPKVLTGSWDLLRPSFDLIRQNIESVALIIIVPALIIELGVMLSENSSQTFSFHNHTGIIIMIVGAILSLVNLPVACYLRVQAAKGEHPSIQECYRKGLPYFLRLIGLNIAVGFLILLGFICLIVPGILLLRRYYLAEFYLIDRNVSIGEAMRLSAAETKPYAGYIWSVIGVVIIINFVSELVSLIFSSIPGLSAIVAILISTVYTFGPVLRYTEIKQVSLGTKKAKKAATV